MWKSNYKCFVIKNRYICTKDKDLANVYSLIKRASTCLDFDGSFETLLKDVLGSLEDFAKHRGLSDKSQYIEIRNILTKACDSYLLSKTELETTRKILIDGLYKLQGLEELADKVFPLVEVKDRTEGYDSKKNYREFRIRATHITRDMSVANSYDKDYYVDIDTLKKSEENICLDSLDGEIIQLISVTEDAVILNWNKKEFHVKYGTAVSTDEVLIENPYLSYDSLKLTFTYREIPNYVELWNMIVSLGCEGLGEKEEILHFIDKAIEKGNTGLYVAKALLTIYNNWGTCLIESIECFQEELLKGIDNGCLAPDNHYGWEWMEVAAKNNDPSTFMENMDLYYEVLDTAMGQGVVEAIDIMNTIWEPEQIIEED